MQILAVCSVIGLISQQANGSIISVSLVPLTKNLLCDIPVLLATPCLLREAIPNAALASDNVRLRDWHSPPSGDGKIATTGN